MTKGYSRNALLFLSIAFVVQIWNQLSLMLLGVWQLATPIDFIRLLSFGFWQEVTAAGAFVSMMLFIGYGLFINSRYRKHAYVVAGFLAAVMVTVVTGFLAYCWKAGFFIEKDTISYILASRFQDEAVWSEFLKFEEAVFFIVAILGVLLLRAYWNLPKQAIQNTDFDTDKFGSAKFADKEELKKNGVYSSKQNPIIGKNESGTLHLPLLNKLTISPPGVGKTTASSIPVLLTHEGPVFAFDVKGELWAVTARFRTEVLKRKVVAIDPFGITQTPEFQEGKSDILKTVYRFNPFDFVPSDPLERDRMINSFASSFVINEGGYSSHFDDNAKILIRGYIDYLMSWPKSSRTLATLFNLMSESLEDSMETFAEMAACLGRAGAAANQISRVGQDERGSILSTSYRQIDWIGDRNIQQSLTESNFDLQDFIRGNMDIFVVIPEDQTKEHSRLFRMLMSLLMSLIVKASPSELPKKKMLFLLEELAQLGACPDVEQCIEVMRARGVVVWSVFQSLKQIKMFSKPDLFLSVPIKQIFTNDDVETMQWVQNLGGKKTVISKSLSSNKGDSQQRSQLLNSQVSQGESESVQETSTDLISLNEIRELPLDEQFVFFQGNKPIRCKKVRYFEHANFKGKFDPNPLENR